jgi:ATP/maltotriose-dependent transcriptional regulator MalT
VCGGCPLTLDKLNEKVKCKDETREEDEKAVRSFVDIEMAIAKKTITLLLDDYPRMKNVILTFNIRNLHISVWFDYNLFL